MKHSRRLLPLLLLVLLLAARIPLRGQTLLDDYRRDVLRYSRALKMAAAVSGRYFIRAAFDSSRLSSSPKMRSV